MFFSDRIKNILPSDKVLEIGPGAAPYHRSDVLLELDYKDEKERSAQFGHEGKLVSDKKVVLYDGKKFPFKDKEFDYLICSHVLEHIEDIPFFLEEIFRVADKGYFEYPMIYYDYLYNFDVHVNFLKWDGKKLFYQKKDATSLKEFKPVQEFFYQTLVKKYSTMLEKMPESFIEGFEWKGRFEYLRTENLSDLVIKKPEIPEFETDLSKDHSYKTLVKALLKKLRR